MLLESLGYKQLLLWHGRGHRFDPDQVHQNIIRHVPKKSQRQRKSRIFRYLSSIDEMSGHGFRAVARTILDEVLGVRPD
jgi:hypothetical protein